MLYNVDLITAAGYKINHRVETDCVTSASDAARQQYPGCRVREVTLIPQKKGNVVIYSEGEQHEAPPQIMFEHFK